MAVQPATETEHVPKAGGGEIQRSASAPRSPECAHESVTVADTAASDHGDVIVDDLLVEEVSIDGMCGVY